MRRESIFQRVLEPEEGWASGSRQAVAASQRARMMDAMVEAVADKGYAAVTVGDVVAGAGVSRRTFYEHFADKEACFLAAYECGADAVLAAVSAAVEAQGDDWRSRVRAGIETYTCVLAREPGLARTLIVDVLGAGPRAVELRQEVYGRFVDRFREARDLAADEELIPELYLRGLVGAIAELVQGHIVAHGADTLEEITPELVSLSVAVFEAARRPVARRR
jgi:AcrR family transcriptional regulator